MWNGTMVDITELKNAENDVKDALDMQKIINDIKNLFEGKSEQIKRKINSVPTTKGEVN